MSTRPRETTFSFPGGGARDEPIRSELVSAERLEQIGETLAADHRLARGFRRGRPLLARMRENGRVLLQSYRAVAEAIREERTISPAAEWLVDNFHIVEEQLREIREDLPQRYYWELPKLAAGQPRVYVLAVELVAHTDSALDEETIVRFVRAFQKAAQLSIGEVWAVPIMLRLALVENLRRLAGHMLAVRRCRHEARRLIAEAQEHQDLPLDLSSWEECAPLVLELQQQLQEMGSDGAVRLKRLTRQLTDRQQSIDDIIRHQNQIQAVNQVSIGNVITSMRLISALDWVSSS